MIFLRLLWFVSLALAPLCLASGFDSTVSNEEEAKNVYSTALIILKMASIGLFSSTMLFHISDGYFGESLRSLSKLLRISDELSAVTLLSVANGAPDLFTALSSPEVSEATGSLNALFLLCIVLGTALLLPEPVKRVSDKKLFETGPFLRSCAVGFLGLAILCALPWFSVGKKLIVPLVMIVVFACYICWIAVFNSKQQRAQPQSPNVVTAGDSAFTASKALDQMSLLAKGYFKADLNLPFRLLMLPAKLVAAFSVLPGRYSLNGKYGMLQRSVSSLAASIGVALF
jgi:Ca2+/Na+ antiporter